MRNGIALVMMHVLKCILLSLACLVTMTAKAQHIFTEKFKGCDDIPFALESDTADARIDREVFTHFIDSVMGEENRYTIRGKLSLQILVYTDGSSCLLSLDNETNVPSRKLNLKKAIDTELRWTAPTKVVSPIVVLEFYRDATTMLRYGMNGKKGGWHQLQER